MTTSEPLARLAAELDFIGRRLQVVSQELQHAQPAPPPAGAPAPQSTVLPPMQPPVLGQVPRQPTPSAGQIPQQPASPAGQPSDPSQIPQQPAAPAGQPVSGQFAQQPASPAGQPSWAGQPSMSWPSSAPQQASGQQTAPPIWPQTQPNYVPPPPLPERLGREGAGSKAVSWIGGSVTLLGIVLLMVLAVQRGWLGPEPRVLVGGGLGLALIAGGLWVHRNPAGRSGAYALAATGIAVLYLDVAAATSLYNLMPQWAGLLIALVVAGGGLLLSARWNAQFIAVWVIIGCALCDPFLTHGFTPLLVSFLVVLQIGAMPVQLLRNWPSLALVAGVPPVLASLFTTVIHLRSGDPFQTAGTALASTIVGVAIAVVITLRDQRDLASPVILLATSPVAALVAGFALTRPEAAWLAAIVAALMLVVVLGDRWLTTPTTVTAAVVGSVALVDATVQALSGPTQAITLLGESLVLVLAADLARHRAALLASLLTSVFGLLWGLTVVSPVLLVVYRSDVDLTVSTALTALLMTAVAIAIPLVAYRMKVIASPTRNAGPWIAAGLVMLYGAAGAVLATALLVSPDRSGFLFGHTVITVSWTVAAIALLLRGIRSGALRAVGLVLVGAAVVKLILFDLAFLDGLARVIAFLVAGLLLLLAGTRYARLVAHGGVITDESRGVTNQVPD
ncbi:DUF2339 domain-containing protein [Kutzneria sp. 744]|uniref:DUF2339 domain-containing protein n=1 Tax=Kutzneria sp. (strain 744) TaxID=345341 RepID=UPI0003EEC783|nr:DUF2339 domain-containing protein [Kutzneria sp. 744]EWM14886.1 LigA protein [Kutzneria sp. 744]